MTSMNITCELQKKLILLFKTNDLFKNLINNVYTYVPENPTYPFIKITCIRKENYYESIENLNYIDTDINVVTNDLSNSSCIKILNKMEKIDLNDEINFKDLDQYYFKKNKSNISQNLKGFWQIDLSILFLYINEVQK
jgi:hypothetical protein